MGPFDSLWNQWSEVCATFFFFLTSFSLTCMSVWIVRGESIDFRCKFERNKTEPQSVLLSSPPHVLWIQFKAKQLLITCSASCWGCRDVMCCGLGRSHQWVRQTNRQTMTATWWALYWSDVLVAMGTQKETAVFYCSGNGVVGEGFTDMGLFFSPERSVSICRVRDGKSKSF